MTSWARPGVKCVCIGKPKSGDLRGIVRVPEIGEVLTVREVFVGVLSDGSEIVSLRFREIANPLADTTWGRVERGYGAHLFRPLVTKSQEQDVALFTHLLTGKPVEVDA